MRAFVRRTIRTSSTNEAMHQEFTRIKQLLVNNGYWNRDIDTEIRRQLDQQYISPSASHQNVTTHHLYYRNFMNTEHGSDEGTLKYIVKKNVKCNNDTHKLILHIYYQSMNTNYQTLGNAQQPDKNKEAHAN